MLLTCPNLLINLYVDQKICNTFKVERPLPEFNKDKKNKDGRECKCRVCKSQYNKNRYNNEDFKKQRRQYLEDNKEHIAKINNPYRKRWAKANRPHINIYRQYKRDNDPQHKLSENIRSRIHAAVKNNDSKKADKSMNLLGCTIKEYREYLEAKFKPGMAWDNHGLYGWHIDHIKPLCSFDLTIPEEQYKAFNFKNTQPLQRSWVCMGRRKP